MDLKSAGYPWLLGCIQAVKTSEFIERTLNNLYVFAKQGNVEIGWLSTGSLRISKKKVTLLGISGKTQILSIRSCVSRLREEHPKIGSNSVISLR